MVIKSLPIQFHRAIVQIALENVPFLTVPAKTERMSAAKHNHSCAISIRIYRLSGQTVESVGAIY